MSKIVDLQGNEIVEKDFDSSSEIEEHMANLHDIDPEEEEWLSSIKGLSPKIRVSVDILNEMTSHLKELSDHYGYDFPEDMICDLLNNGMINLSYEQNNV